jgi:hypothetical protein
MINSISHDFFHLFEGFFEDGIERFCEQLIYHQAALAFHACSNSMVKVRVCATS